MGVHEQMGEKDQDTLARYALVLERKIEHKMKEKHALRVAVHHLRSESDAMRFSAEEQKDQHLQLVAQTEMADPRNETENRSSEGNAAELPPTSMDDDARSDVDGGANGHTADAQRSSEASSGPLRNSSTLDAPRMQRRAVDPNAVVDRGSGAAKS